MSLQVATILVRVRHFDREGLQLQMADLHSSSVLYTLTEIVATCKLNITLVQWRDKRQAKKLSQTTPQQDQLHSMLLQKLCKYAFTPLFSIP